MERFVVHEDAAATTGMHALLIGVGRYPHLIGGSGPLYVEHGGMQQLTSPPLSASSFAEWLTKHHRYPTKPLASLALLVGGTEPTDFAHPLSGQVHALERPLFPHVEQAVKEWKARGDSSPDNLMLMYFCGHGIANGPDLSLLCEDFGADPDAALDSAIDFRRFHLGMERCKARQQIFLIDACRVADSNLLDAAGYAGRPILQPTTRHDRTLPARLKPAFYSTFAGHKAQSRTDEVSLFTDAVIKAFAGGGADDTDGEWWIDTSQLQKVVQFLMERAHSRYPSAQINPVDDMATFRLHHLEGEPRVPVVVGCRPENRNAAATLSCTTISDELQRPPEESDWDLELAAGEYTFEAQFDGGDPPSVQAERTVRPPYRTVHLEVT